MLFGQSRNGALTPLPPRNPSSEGQCSCSELLPSSRGRSRRGRSSRRHGAPLPLLSSVLSRHAAAWAEDSHRVKKRLAVLFPRGKRKTVTMGEEARAQVRTLLRPPTDRPYARARGAHLSGVVARASPAPHGSKRLKRMVRKHARRADFNSFLAEYESRLDRPLHVNVAASPLAGDHPRRGHGQRCRPPP